MFDRLLGPRIDHSDPKIRARAYGHDSIEQDVLIAALKKEQDADVLCVILDRVTDVASLLECAKTARGSIANQARGRLVALASDTTSASSHDWQNVYTTAYSENWGQSQALTDLINPSNQQDGLLVGALEAQPESPRIDERILLSLATQAPSSGVRRLAAARLQERSMLEECCSELKDKDKSVYREVRARLDNIKLGEERQALAGQLLQELEKLMALEVTAEVEVVAVTQSRFEQVEQKITELAAQDPEAAKTAVAQLERVSQAVTDRLEKARGYIRQRKEIKASLDKLIAELNGASEGATTATANHIDQLETSWSGIPDHSESDHRRFKDAALVARQALTAQQNEAAIDQNWSERLDRWEEEAKSGNPTKLASSVARAWESGEKPQSAEATNALDQRVRSLLEQLKQREQQLAQKRASNSEQLLAILTEFEETMAGGEFKKAMSLNDKLKSRLANRELDAGPKKKVEAALKQAQPKLEEFRKWRHFGTQQARDNLIGEVNTLISNPPASPKAVSVAVKALRESWRKLDKDDGRASEVLWQTFNKACKEAYKPAKKHFDQLAKERKANLAEKKQLLESFEQLLNDTDWSSPSWEEVVKAHKDLVNQWHRVGTVDYKVRKELDASYESISQRFEDQLKDERESELSRRRRLIDDLKAQQESESGGRLAAAAKRAQRDWRPTVQGDRKTEQALWKEFRAVCDDIFGSLKQQQKEFKQAWQAEVTERESLCEEVDKLLASGGAEQGAKEANAAKGQLDGFARQWKERHQIPSGIAGKLDARFNKSRKAAQSRISAALRQEEKRTVERLDGLLDRCQAALEALLSGSYEAETYRNGASDFEGLRGANARALEKRYEQIVKAMEGDAEIRRSIEQSLDSNLADRRSMCLLGELVVDIESPSDLEQERMALKMKRLTEAMQGELESSSKELTSLIDQWFQTGGVEAAHWPDLHSRFKRVRNASIASDQ